MTMSKAKKSETVESPTVQVIPLAEVATVKAAMAKGLPKGCSVSVRKGGRGCPDGHAVVSVVELE
jgi:hypothetical protein